MPARAAAAGPAEPRTLPPARVAVTSHTGALDGLALAYFPLIAHVEERGLRPAPVVREVYATGRTEVLLPFTSHVPGAAP